jgi:hypothetical protein
LIRFIGACQARIPDVRVSGYAGKCRHTPHSRLRSVLFGRVPKTRMV